MKKLLLGIALLALLGIQPAHAASISFRLTWTDTSDNETGFNVERGTSQAGPFTQIAQTGQDVATYTDTPIAPGATLCYRVNAFNAVGASGYSNVACATAPSVPSSPGPIVIDLVVQ